MSADETAALPAVSTTVVYPCRGGARRRNRLRPQLSGFGAPSPPSSPAATSSPRNLLPAPFLPLAVPRNGRQRKAAAATVEPHTRAKHRLVLNRVNQCALQALLDSRQPSRSPRRTLSNGTSQTGSPAALGSQAAVHETAFPPVTPLRSTAADTIATPAPADPSPVPFVEMAASIRSVGASTSPRQERIDATSRAVLSQVAVLESLRDGTHGRSSGTLDLSSSGLTDAHSGILATVLGCHPTLTHVDLSRNRIGDVAGRALHSAALSNRSIAHVTLDGTRVPAAWRSAIEAQCELNRTRRDEAVTASRRRRQKRDQAVHRLAQEREQQAVVSAERRGRGEVAGEWRAVLKELKAGRSSGAAAQARREARAQARAARLEQRRLLAAAESVLRDKLLESEMVLRLGLGGTWEQGGRVGCASEQQAARKHLKKLENDGWIQTRRKEKARRRREAGQREDMCAAQDKVRADVEAEQLRVLDALAVDREASHDDAARRERERTEHEEQEEWKRRQEELRIDKERERKEQVLAREQARKEAERQRERERKENSERMARAVVMRQEDSVREQLIELAGIAHRVAAARDSFGRAERAKVRLFSTEPEIHLEGDPVPLWHFTGGFAVHSPVTESFRLTRDTRPLTSGENSLRWGQVDKKCADERKRLHKELADAAKLLKSRQRDLAHALCPHLCDRPDWPIRSGLAAVTSSPNMAKLRRSPQRDPLVPAASRGDYLKAVEEALQSSEAAAKWFDVAEAQLPASPPSDQVHAAKLCVVSCVIDAELSVPQGSDELEPPEGSEELTCASPGAASAVLPSGGLRVVLDELGEGGDIGLDAITDALQAIRYRCAAPSDWAPCAQRRLTVRVTVECPQVSPQHLSRFGVLSSADFLTATTKASAEVSLTLLVVAPLITAPLPSLSVTFEEDTAADKTVLLPSVALSEVPHLTRTSEGGFVYDAALSQSTSYRGGTVSVRFTSNYTVDDQIVLQRMHDDDIGVSGDGLERELLDGHREGPAFARVSAGVLLTHKEAETRAEIPAEGGFELEIFGAKAQLLTRFLRRLRFCNFSQKPSADQRVVEVGIADSAGHRSFVEVRVDVVNQDDPAVFELAHKRLYYRRQGSMAIAEELRKHLRPSVLPLFPGVAFYDPDTVYIKGGDLVIIAPQGLQRGDCLGIRSARDPEHVHVEGHDEVCYQGVAFARLEKGFSSVPEPEYRAEPRTTPNLLSAGSLAVPQTSGQSTPKAPASPSVSSQSSSASLVGDKVGRAVQKGKRINRLRNASQTAAVLRRIQNSVNADEPNTVLKVTFFADGTASVPMVKALLNSIVFTNTTYAPDAELRPWRQFEATVRLGPDAVPPANIAGTPEPESGQVEYQLLKNSVEVRVTQELLEIPAAHSSTEYREGSGMQRLAPFEVVSDQQGFVDSYNDGFVLVETVGGFTDDDVVNVRSGSKEGDLRIVLRKGAEGTIPDLDATANGTSEDEEECPAQDDASDDERARDNDEEADETQSASALGEKRRSVRDRVRDKLQAAMATKRARRESLLEKTKKDIQAMVKQGIDERTMQSSVSDVSTSGNKRVGTLTIQSGKLYLKFGKKGVSRKEVLMVLRALTYTNKSSKPDVLSKVLRVTLLDGGFVPSQALVTIDVQTVDDVTEIRMTNPRPRYRPGTLLSCDVGCWPLAPLRRVCLADPDTEFFDGGWLVVELVGGGQKGDTLSFMSVDQQERARADSDLAVEQLSLRRQGQRSSLGLQPDVWDEAVFDEHLYLYDGGKKICTQDGLDVGTLEYTRGMFAGTNNVKVTFNRHSPKRIDIRIAGYVLNCISFEASVGTAAEKISPGQRTYAVRVSDGENPIEGKVKIFIDVLKPLVVVPNQPAGPRDLTPGEPTQLFDKVQGFVAAAEGKGSQVGLQHGSTQVEIVDGAVEGDTLAISEKGSISTKDGAVYYGNDFLGKLGGAGVRRGRRR
eukprot:TRINITY_DN10882_c0_g2_i3.p1 TRINITY_DN10882_c0_g2~~TRINITY_DN10882_c0_g2_i3.p1  ORF type:complete len:1972 (+),score=617.10 TRINITY_DN10882_c0_g2_i3:76-5916(+)